MHQLVVIKIKLVLTRKSWILNLSQLYFYLYTNTKNESMNVMSKIWLDSPKTNAFFFFSLNQRGLDVSRGIFVLRFTKLLMAFYSLLRPRRVKRRKWGWVNHSLLMLTLMVRGGAQCARTFFRRLFLHEKKGYRGPKFLDFS